MPVQINNVPGWEQTLKCSLCLKWLTVFPIYYSPTIGNVCGRCHDPSTASSSDCFRTENYELLMKEFLFPCSNEEYGCGELLNYIEINSHEATCVFAFNCFICDDFRGTFQELNSHIIDSHTDNILNPAIVDLETIEDVDNVYFLREHNEIFTVIIKSPEIQKWSFLIMYNGVRADSESFSYQLKLSSDDVNNFVMLPKSDVKVYGALNEVDEIDLESLKWVFKESKSFSCKINVYNKHKPEVRAKLAGMSNVHPDFQCPICAGCMIPPILLCRVGHSFCKMCASKVSKCPLCCDSMTTARNYSLESIINAHVHYPCKNQLRGCTFTSDAERVQTHEKNCKYGDIQCKSITGNSTNCLWLGSIRDIGDHFNQCHNRSRLLLNKSFALDISEVPFHKYYFALEKFGIFKFYIKRQTADSPVQCLMEHFRKFSESDSQFYFRLKFVDTTDDGHSFLTLKQLCQEYVAVPAFKDYLNFPLNMLKPFLRESNKKLLLNFKISIN